MHTQNPPSGAKPPISFDDYCRIFGRVIFDAFLRIDSLERQFGPIQQSLQTQSEMLRSQLGEANRKIAELQHNDKKEHEPYDPQDRVRREGWDKRKTTPLNSEEGTTQ